MQAVRAAGYWALRSCPWPRAAGVVAGARGLCDAPPPEAAEQAAARRGGFSIYPPLPGQESSLRWAGKKFEEIPIAHIKASYNNTQIQVVSATNQSLARTSCGTEGFRNAKKATGVAAQTAAIAAAASAIKGLTMGGLEVISITDNTPIPHNGCRPKKARRL
ncbi:small ribosomal subunit protein uS11m isoform X2 [Ochotona princeps]|uniref:small ribosomal subunit protein uS11m isoform X2 n=1 Tax=Ochotona princeps TaxID=9978 RepID=UPI0027154E72|nr:small ribosomal subunit protein uS11m isoform X2 [Ochotona princeps]